MGSSHVGGDVGLSIWIRASALLEIPDLGIVADGAIAGEVARVCSGQDRTLDPLLLVAVQLINAILCFEVCGNEYVELVMMTHMKRKSAVVKKKQSAKS